MEFNYKRSIRYTINKKMKSNITKHIIITAVTLTPFIAFAVEALSTIIARWTNTVTLIINFLLVVATLVFVWGIIKYVAAGGDAAKVKEARGYIVWGLLGLAVMASVWVIVRVIQLEVINTAAPETTPFPRYNIPSQ